jgi:hypothetical protein
MYSAFKENKYSVCPGDEQIDVPYFNEHVSTFVLMFVKDTDRDSKGASFFILTVTWSRNSRSVTPEKTNKLRLKPILNGGLPVGFYNAV